MFLSFVEEKVLLVESSILFTIVVYILNVSPKPIYLSFGPNDSAIGRWGDFREQDLIGGHSSQGVWP